MKTVFCLRYSDSKSFIFSNFKALHIFLTNNKDYFKIDKLLSYQHFMTSVKKKKIFIVKCSTASDLTLTVNDIITLHNVNKLIFS